jgi:hypothetical protein
MVCSDSYSFNFNTAGIAIYTKGFTGTNCALDYLVIESMTSFVILFEKNVSQCRYICMYVCMYICVNKRYEMYFLFNYLQREMATQILSLFPDEFSPFIVIFFNAGVVAHDRRIGCLLPHALLSSRHLWGHWVSKTAIKILAISRIYFFLRSLRFVLHRGWHPDQPVLRRLPQLLLRRHGQLKDSG